MEKEEYNKVFLFGAGAEVCYGLSSGADFAKIIIGNKENKKNDINEMNKAIKKHYKYKANNWYPPYHEYRFKEDDLFVAAIKKKFLDDEIDTHNKKGFDDLIIRETRNLKSQKSKIIDNYTSYMGILDEIFHTLISPKYLGPNKFWGVVGCYTRAYLLLTGEMVKKLEKRTLSQKDYLEMLEKPLEYYNKWNDFVNNDDSYYAILNKYKENNKFAIITTNYTPICDNVTGIKDIAHVNGRLNWFESPYKLKVYDITKQEQLCENDMQFPYLFVQSGIKPIVEENQIEEYSKMLRYFKNTNSIIIVGYRINADDNHINSFLRSAICDGKKIIYFNHNNSLNKEQIYKRLRLCESEKTIEIINVNKDDCISKFEEIICGE